MRRGKPQQQLYRPGSGPLRKTTAGIEETESDTNLVLNSRQNHYKGSSPNNSRVRSEGSTPRDCLQDLESATDKVGDMTIRDSAKKAKKPEQPLYVPRAVAQARGDQNPPTDSRPERNDQQLNGNCQHYYDGSTSSHRSKNYSNRRRQSDSQEYQEDWRPASPLHQPNRNIRQGSEPRGHGSSSNWHRMRDTRSVEPNVVSNRNYGSEKSHMKPPSGRRHSTSGSELPPRFRKKFLEENRLGSNYSRVQEESSWDGTSLTFQGTSSQPQPQHNWAPDYQQSMPPYSKIRGGYMNQSHQHVSQHQHMQQGNVYYSLPRGRGRLQHDYEHPMGSYTVSRPPTPPPFANVSKSNENLSQYGSRPQTPVHVQKVDENYNRNQYGGGKYADNRYAKSEERSHKGQAEEDRPRRTHQADGGKRTEVDSRARTPKADFRLSLEVQLSPVSPPTPEEKIVMPLVTVSATTLDWSEEVELNDRLEQEALSDALTRSSSIASLMEVSTKSLPSNPKRSNRRKNKKGKRRSGSAARDQSLDNSRSYQRNGRDDTRDGAPGRSIEPYDSNKDNDSNRDKGNFKVPEGHGRRRRNSRDRRDHSFERRRNRSRTSREPSFERNRRSSTTEHENWREEKIRSRQNSEREEKIRSRQNSEREEMIRSRQNSEREEKIRSRQNSERDGSKESERKDLDMRKGGIIVLPQSKSEVASAMDRPRYPETFKKSSSPGQQQKSLFDPNNPHKPIIIKSSSTRVSIPGFSDNTEAIPPQLYMTDQFGNTVPIWYDERSENFKRCHYPDLLRDIVRADRKLQYIINSGSLFLDWENVYSLRCFLLESLEYLLNKDLKFCQVEKKVEEHFWKILFHNIIEMTRKALLSDAHQKEQREQYKKFVLWLIDDGTKYFEELLDRLQQTYKFKLSDFLGQNVFVQRKGLEYTGIALISAQKILLFLGDLGRYREQVNETTNYGKCRQWYIKAQEVNPKNGKPYKRLADLAVCARRKLDAVYYFMRSLMASNPAPSAKESLTALFDDNRRKYEQGERKRREERLERARQHMKEKESDATAAPSSLRKEIWIHPDSGKRVHRTTSAVQEQKTLDSEEEDLASLSSVEVNKRFVTSYLHVLGKLSTKIGMESFQEAALQMLKEFRALLQHSPVPLPCNRFLQLLALNMYSIESTQLQHRELDSSESYRSELQERALVVSLQMFNLILERCVSLLQEHIRANPESATMPLPMDAQVLLPAVKIWCDWLECHIKVWNPPPSTLDYRVGPPGDAWSRLASLMNLLEKLDTTPSSTFVSEHLEGYEPIRLPEHAVLSGFTPLMVAMELAMEKSKYVPKDFDMELAQFTLRIEKLNFFGTIFLCGIEPPVLKLKLVNGYEEYVSVVQTSANRDSPASPPELNDTEDLMVESFSEDEGEEDNEKAVQNVPSEIRELLSRKVELERRHRNQELHRQRVKKILSQSVVSVHIEIRPKYLVPDTNCFIDYLVMIKAVAEVQFYTLMVPLVVLNELEGLAKGGKTSAPVPKTDYQHVLKVAESAKQALEFLSNRHPSIKCITTKGTVLTSMTFTVEDDSATDGTLKNDDKILSACLTLCKGSKEPQVEGEPRKLFREVVLLTEDRNLRVKALARDVPVRELPDFLQWVGLG